MKLLIYFAFLNVFLAVKSENEITYQTSEKRPDVTTISTENGTISKAKAGFENKYGQTVTNGEVSNVVNKSKVEGINVTSTAYPPTYGPEQSPTNYSTFEWILVGLGVFGSVCVAFGAIFGCCKLICDKHDDNLSPINEPVVVFVNEKEEKSNKSTENDCQTDSKENYNYTRIQ